MHPRVLFISVLKIAALMVLFVNCFTVRLLAQSNRRISGTITDSTKAGLADVKVMVVAGKDSLTTLTDQDGNFNFSKINVEQFLLKITAPGYYDLASSYSFAVKEKHKRLAAIQLKMNGQMLKEVVINAKPNPVRFMQDTVEYNAAAFRVEEGDNVADLMKQFPGIEIDGDYNVKVGDKAMTKLRVNGKDFFTNNVKDFIGRLPAGIVSKIQVVDDFGDHANFTGIKIGEPVKMLNIVTKPGMDRGLFGNISANTATNSMIGAQVQMNLWKGEKQSSANANASTANNGAGISKLFGLGLSHNGKLGESSTGGFGYNFSNNSTAFNRQQVTESLNPGGNFINNTQSNGNNNGGNHNLRWNMNVNNKKVLLQASVYGQYNYSNNLSASLSQQSGLIRQDLINNNSSNSSTPSINGSISFSKNTKNRKDNFSVNASFTLSNSNNSQRINTNTLYYDKTTGALLKDSLLNRDVNSKTGNQQLGFGVNYSVGLKKPKDTLARQSLNFTYNGSVSSSDNKVSTFVFDNLNKKIFQVDSLSTSFNSNLFDQSLAASYNYSSVKVRYNIGFRASANLLSNHDLKTGQTIVNNAYNYAPSLNFSRTLATGKTLSISYQGTTRSPTINQLQPVRNAQSLQNIVVGNPNLKTSFTHNMNANFNYAQKSGRSLQVGVNATAIQNEIVSNISLLPDTLNTLKQVTRYENINGNYQVNGNYLFHIPFKQNKYAVSYSGRLGSSNRVILYNGQKISGAGFNLFQQLSGNLSFKKITLNAQVSYTITSNNNTGVRSLSIESQQIGIGQITTPIFFRTTTLGASLQSNLRLEKMRFSTNLNYSGSHNNSSADQVVPKSNNINMSLSGQFTIRKSYSANFNASKTMSYGNVQVANSGPLLINVGVAKSLLKNRTLNISIQGSDLLGQGNKLQRSAAGNTIIDSRNIQPTQVFSLNLTYSLSNFGGKNMQVFPDLRF